MVYVIQVCSQLSSRIRILLKSCLSTCMTYTIVECTVNNSWWWIEEQSKTRRVSFPKKIWEIVHVVGFIIRKFVTMHSHMNVKLDRGTAPCILNLGTRQEWSGFCPGCFSSKERGCQHLFGELVGRKAGMGTLKEKQIFCPCTQLLSHSAHSLVIKQSQPGFHVSWK
jgi:hypothetical protein